MVILGSWEKNCEHITPTLVHLHWLPVKFRIDYKVLTLVFKSLARSGSSLHLMSPFTLFVHVAEDETRNSL